jgi:dipeptidyl aminopeptidase/acylaminoacyl peptidase
MSWDELRGIGKDVDCVVFDDDGHDVLKLTNRMRCYDAIRTFFSERLTSS